MKRAETIKSLDKLNDLRVTIKDLGRQHSSKGTHFVINKNATPEQWEQIKRWVVLATKLGDKVKSVLKLCAMETWNNYFLFGGCNGLREVQMLRSATREFLQCIARRPKTVTIQPIKDVEDQNEKAH
jgi:hypothetical protein